MLLAPNLSDKPIRRIPERHIPSDPESVDIRTIIRFVQRKWHLVLMWVALGAFCGVAFIALAPSYYTAYTTMLLNDNSLRAAPEAGAQVPPADAATFVHSQIQVLQSNEVLDPVIDKQHLLNDPEFGGKASGFFSGLLGGARSVLDSLRHAESGQARPEASARHLTMARLKRALSINQLGTSNAVDIGITSRSPAKAAAIVNAIARSYIDGQIERRRKAQEEATQRLRERLVELRNKAFSPQQDSQAASPAAAPDTTARARFRETQDNAELYRTLYNNLKREYVNSGSQISSPDARVISKAEPPLYRSWPRAIIVLMAAIAAGGAIGTSHALLQQATDNSLGTAGEVRRSTEVDLVVIVPRISMIAWARDVVDKRLFHANYRKHSSDIENSLAKAAVRLHTAESERKVHVVGVAALAPGAGASLIAAHLARLLVRSGRKTLLIDANWSKARSFDGPLQFTPVRRLASTMVTLPVGSDSLDVLLLRGGKELTNLNASLSVLAALQFRHAEEVYDYIVVDFCSPQSTADMEASLDVIDDILLVSVGAPEPNTMADTMNAIPNAKVAAIIMNKGFRLS